MQNPSPESVVGLKLLTRFRKQGLSDPFPACYRSRSLSIVYSINSIFKEEIQIVSFFSHLDLQVIQRRDDFGEPRENFNRDWSDYKNGFGDPAKEFWLGNENIYMLTNNEDYSLRVELEDFEGNKRYVLSILISHLASNFPIIIYFRAKISSHFVNVCVCVCVSQCIAIIKINESLHLSLAHRDTHTLSDTQV